jgi:Flp pilus assembly pilin Flp
MSATKSHRIGGSRYQDGVAAVEFALLVIAFLIVLFGILEVARVMYMFNTLAEVTRSAARGAANTSFKDTGGLDLVRKRAVFNETTGELPFGSPINYRHVRFEYLSLRANSYTLETIPEALLPSCPAKNRLICMNDPNGPNTNCIRAVRASICAEGQAEGACTAVEYKTIFPFIPMPLTLPTSVTIVTAESLGYRAGDLPCN